MMDPVEHAARLSVAPMMEWTDRHCRYFLRLISRRALLYTEMITTGAVLHGDRARLLAFDPAERPLALQLGGADPAALAECARIAADLGFDEVNLNVGCPSDRVQSGRFGACLMAEPDLVASCVAAMARTVTIPVTVKHRIGIDDQRAGPAVRRFVRTLADAGCRRIIVHARKAWLHGLSPRQNREIPPLHYAMVYGLKLRFPALHVSVNGGVTSVSQAMRHLARVDGVMIGRAAYQDPYMLAEIDGQVFGDPAPPRSRAQIVGAMLPYIDQACAKGVPLQAITRHMLGLYNGQPDARRWRRHLSEQAHRPGAGANVVSDAAALVDGRPAAAA